MKATKAKPQSLLLSLIAISTFFSTSTAGAVVTRAPAWITALDTINDRAITPTTGVYDPNCDDARVWDIKLIDHNGDGVPDEDRKASNHSGVGLVYGRDSLATTFAVSKRHLVTVAHIFEDADGRVENRPSGEQVRMEGCPGEIYQVTKRTCGTDNSLVNKAKDYCVLELDRDLCSAAEIYNFGAPSESEITSHNLTAVGYYVPQMIGEETIRAQLGDENHSGLTQVRKTLGDFRQYSSEGRVIDSANSRGQRIDMYQMGQYQGGSGGPLISVVNGQPTVVGIQFMEPGEVEKNFNFSIAADGVFLDFVRRNVPDLRTNDAGI